MGQTFRDRLRLAIEMSGFSVKEVALRANVSKGTIDNWVASTPTVPKATDAVAVAQILNVTVEWLVLGDEAEILSDIFLTNCRGLQKEGFIEPVEIFANAYFEQLIEGNLTHKDRINKRK